MTPCEIVLVCACDLTNLYSTCVLTYLILSFVQFVVGTARQTDFLLISILRFGLMVQFCINCDFSSEISRKFQRSLPACLFFLCALFSITMSGPGDSATSPVLPKRFDFTAFKEQGESLGLTGLDLANFVKDREQAWLAEM